MRRFWAGILTIAAGTGGDNQGAATNESRPDESTDYRPGRGARRARLEALVPGSEPDQRGEDKWGQNRHRCGSRMLVSDSEEDGDGDECQRSDDDDPFNAGEDEHQCSWTQESCSDDHGVLAQSLGRLSSADAVRGAGDSVVHPHHRPPNGVTWPSGMTPRLEAASTDPHGPSPGCACLAACKGDSGISQPVRHMSSVITTGDLRFEAGDLTFEGPLAEFGGLVPVRIHALDATPPYQRRPPVFRTASP